MDSDINIRPSEISTKMNDDTYDSQTHERVISDKGQPIDEDGNQNIAFQSKSEPVRAPRKKDNFRGVYTGIFTPQGIVQRDADSSLENDDSLSQDEGEAGLCMEVEEIQDENLDDTFEDEVEDEPGPNSYSTLVSKSKGKSIQGKSLLKKSYIAKPGLKLGDTHTAKQPPEVSIIVNHAGQVFTTSKQAYGKSKEQEEKTKGENRKSQLQPKVKFAPRKEFEPPHTSRKSNKEKSSMKILPWTRPLPVGERCCPCHEGTKCILCPCAQDGGECTPGCRVKLCRFQPGNEKHNPGCEVRMVEGKTGSTVNVSWPRRKSNKETSKARERGEVEKTNTTSPSKTHSLLETDQDFWDKMVLGKKPDTTLKTSTIDEPDEDSPNTTHIQIVKQLGALPTHVPPSSLSDGVSNEASNMLNGEEMHIEIIVMSEDDDFIDEEDREDFDEYVIGSPEVNDPENQSLYEEKDNNLHPRKSAGVKTQRAKQLDEQSDRNKMVTEIRYNEGNYEVQVHSADSNVPVSSPNEAAGTTDLPKPSTEKQPRKKTNRFKINPLPDEIPLTLGPLTIEIDDEQETEQLAEPKFVKLTSPTLSSSKQIKTKAKLQPKAKEKLKVKLPAPKLKTSSVFKPSPKKPGAGKNKKFIPVTRIKEKNEVSSASTSAKDEDSSSQDMFDYDDDEIVETIVIRHPSLSPTPPPSRLAKKPAKNSNKDMSDKKTKRVSLPARRFSPHEFDGRAESQHGRDSSRRLSLSPEGGRVESRRDRTAPRRYSPSPEGGRVESRRERTVVAPRRYSPTAGTRKEKHKLHGHSYQYFTPQSNDSRRDREIYPPKRFSLESAVSKHTKVKKGTPKIMLKQKHKTVTQKGNIKKTKGFKSPIKQILPKYTNTDWPEPPMFRKPVTVRYAFVGDSATFKNTFKVWSDYTPKSTPKAIDTPKTEDDLTPRGRYGRPSKYRRPKAQTIPLDSGYRERNKRSPRNNDVRENDANQDTDTCMDVSDSRQSVDEKMDVKSPKSHVKPTSDKTRSPRVPRRNVLKDDTPKSSATRPLTAKALSKLKSVTKTVSSMTFDKRKTVKVRSYDPSNLASIATPPLEIRDISAVSQSKDKTSPVIDKKKKTSRLSLPAVKSKDAAESTKQVTRRRASSESTKQEPRRRASSESTKEEPRQRTSSESKRPWSPVAQDVSPKKIETRRRGSSQSSDSLVASMLVRRRRSSDSSADLEFDPRASRRDSVEEDERLKKEPRSNRHKGENEESKIHTPKKKSPVAPSLSARKSSLKKAVKRLQRTPLHKVPSPDASTSANGRPQFTPRIQFRKTKNKGHSKLNKSTVKNIKEEGIHVTASLDKEFHTDIDWQPKVDIELSPVASPTPTPPAKKSGTAVKRNSKSDSPISTPPPKKRMRNQDEKPEASTPSPSVKPLKSKRNSGVELKSPISQQEKKKSDVKSPSYKSLKDKLKSSSDEMKSSAASELKSPSMKSSRFITIKSPAPSKGLKSPPIYIPRVQKTPTQKADSKEAVVVIERTPESKLSPLLGSSGKGEKVRSPSSRFVGRGQSAFKSPPSHTRSAGTGASLSRDAQLHSSRNLRSSPSLAANPKEPGTVANDMGGEGKESRLRGTNKKAIPLRPPKISGSPLLQMMREARAVEAKTEPDSEAEKSEKQISKTSATNKASLMMRPSRLRGTNKKAVSGKITRAKLEAAISKKKQEKLEDNKGGNSAKQTLKSPKSANKPTGKIPPAAKPLTSPDKVTMDMKSTKTRQFISPPLKYAHLGEKNPKASVGVSIGSNLKVRPGAIPRAAGRSRAQQLLKKATQRHLESAHVRKAKEQAALKNKKIAEGSGDETSSQGSGREGRRTAEGCGFFVGGRLEAIDKNNAEFTCVASVAGVKGEYLRVHFDGWPKGYDFWCRPNSPYIHPVGWCQANGHPLSPPQDWPDMSSFTWEKYLADVKAKPIPLSAFRLKSESNAKVASVSTLHPPQTRHKALDAKGISTSPQAAVPKVKTQAETARHMQPVVEIDRLPDHVFDSLFIDLNNTSIKPSSKGSGKGRRVSKTLSSPKTPKIKKKEISRRVSDANTDKVRKPMTDVGKVKKPKRSSTGEEKRRASNTSEKPKRDSTGLVSSSQPEMHPIITGVSTITDEMFSRASSSQVLGEPENKNKTGPAIVPKKEKEPAIAIVSSTSLSIPGTPIVQKQRKRSSSVNKEGKSTPKVGSVQKQGKRPRSISPLQKKGKSIADVLAHRLVSRAELESMEKQQKSGSTENNTEASQSLVAKETDSDKLAEDSSTSAGDEATTSGQNIGFENNQTTADSSMASLDRKDPEDAQNVDESNVTSSESEQERSKTSETFSRENDKTETNRRDGEGNDEPSAKRRRLSTSEEPGPSMRTVQSDEESDHVTSTTDDVIGSPDVIEHSDVTQQMIDAADLSKTVESDAEKEYLAEATNETPMAINDEVSSESKVDELASSSSSRISAMSQATSSSMVTESESDTEVRTGKAAEPMEVTGDGASDEQCAEEQFGGRAAEENADREIQNKQTESRTEFDDVSHAINTEKDIPMLDTSEIGKESNITDVNSEIEAMTKTQGSKISTAEESLESGQTVDVTPVVSEEQNDTTDSDTITETEGAKSVDDEKNAAKENLEDSVEECELLDLDKEEESSKGETSAQNIQAADKFLSKLASVVKNVKMTEVAPSSAQVDMDPPLSAASSQSDIFAEASSVEENSMDSTTSQDRPSAADDQSDSTAVEDDDKQTEGDKKMTETDRLSPTVSEYSASDSEVAQDISTKTETQVSGAKETTIKHGADTGTNEAKQSVMQITEAIQSASMEKDASLGTSLAEDHMNKAMSLIGEKAGEAIVEQQESNTDAYQDLLLLEELAEQVQASSAEKKQHHCAVNFIRPTTANCFACVLCKKDYNWSAAEAAKHVIDTHTRCIVCKQSFNEVYLYQQHVDQHAEIPALTERMNHMTEKAIPMSEVSISSRDFISQSEGRNECVLCNSSFISESLVSEHVESFHLNTP